VETQEEEYKDMLEVLTIACLAIDRFWQLWIPFGLIIFEKSKSGRVSFSIPKCRKIEKWKGFILNFEKSKSRKMEGFHVQFREVSKSKRQKIKRLHFVFGKIYFLNFVGCPSS